MQKLDILEIERSKSRLWIPGCRIKVVSDCRKDEMVAVNVESVLFGQSFPMH